MSSKVPDKPPLGTARPLIMPPAPPLTNESSEAYQKRTGYCYICQRVHVTEQMRQHAHLGGNSTAWNAAKAQEICNHARYERSQQPEYSI